jgi:antitoxin HigA-1
LGSDTLLWLAPTLGAMFMWGVAQGLVKKYIGEVPPARFCLYYALANAAVSLAFWGLHDTPPAFAPENRQFATWGLIAYVLDGVAWIFYYQSIVHGPISIVGTLSAAYPALTVLRVPVTRMSEIVNGRRGVTADTALRLARYFGTTAEFWMNLQAAYDLGVAQRASADRIARDVHPREAA